MQLVVIAKEPVPGRVKTRLCPPCTPRQAADIAEAALGQTLDTVARTPADRKVLLLDGNVGGWLPPGIEVIAQRGEGLGDRLAAGFADCFASDCGPVVLVGMDTPQVTPSHLLDAASLLTRQRGIDAVLGPAADGGYWLIGLGGPSDRGSPFEGVPMSEPSTFDEQRGRLQRCGYEVAVMEQLVDVDTIEDAQRVAGEQPGTRFARAVATVEPTLVG
jgi:rSAM/selenodomain-associated transferase 1